MRAKIDMGLIPEKVRTVASALRSAPGRAYLVGGPVRDLLMKKKPQDWDIATDIPPRKVLSLFPDAITVGIEYGRVQAGGVDVVSLRSESSYADGRHPSSVSFGVSVEEDLRRRDFTVNAMAAEFPDLRVIDLFGGAEDLARRVLRPVGDPYTRMSEDPLRILRAIRFKTVLGMNLDPSLAALLSDTAHLLSRISGERVFSELRRILLSPGVYQGTLDLHAYGLGSVVLPEVFSKGEAHVELRSKALSMTNSDLPTRIALLFRESDGGEVETALARFGLDSHLRRDVLWLVCHRARQASDKRVGEGIHRDAAYEVRRLIHDGGEENVRRLFDLEYALSRAEGRVLGEVLGLAAGLALAGGRAPDPLRLTGDDVMRITGTSGPAVGDALSHLWDLVLRDPDANTKQALESALREWWEER